ncbi:MAG: peptide ABC transporter substrate-binding protein [Caulobacteraceae bacterium]|nr:peptide ABC transporter substrate-binding protein [Caulobacteraceae bacterium]
MSRTKALLSEAALLSVLAALAACGPHKAVRPPCSAGQVCLELGNDAEPISLSPLKITGTWEDRVVSDLIVGLTQSDPEGRPIPGMATSWETSPDGETWTFHLREAVWSDGVPVTADDFVFAMRRLMDPAEASEYASVLYVIKNAEAANEGKLPPTALGVKALDPHTLQITLEHPAPYLLELAKHQTMLPVPQHVVAKWGDDWSKPEHYVGNGPFKLVSWTLGDHIHVVKNPLFWDAKSVCVDQIDYYPTVDPVAAEKRVRSGELDANGSIQANRVAFLKEPGQMPAYVRVHSYLGVSYLAFNTHDPGPLRDRRVRIALAMSIDRDFIAQKLDKGVVQAAYTFVPPGTANYTPPPPPVWASWPLARRQAAARILLAEAGYGLGRPLKLELKHSISTGADVVMPSIQADWKAVGVALSLAEEDAQINYQDLRMRNFQIGSAGWIADYDDAMNFLYLNESSTGAQNYGDYHNPAYDRLLAEADQEPDAKKRAAEMRQAEAIMLADQPVTPITFATNTDLVNPRITGWVDNILDQHRSRYLCVKGVKGPPYR